MRRGFLLSLAAVLLSSGAAFAQATATINGRVIDQDKAVIPGVTITIVNAATAVTRNTVSNAEGLFSVPALPPGIYEVRVEIAGFAPAARKIDLLIGSTTSVDFELGLAQLAETVTVQSGVPLVEITQATMSATIRQTEVAQLPMINRSLAAMITLLPGAREVPASGSHGHAATYVSFAGNTGRSYNMYVDGVDNKEDQDGGTLVQLSLDGIEEFRSLGSGSPAEYGRGSTVVVLATRSGTNQLRGSLFGFGRNESLIATDYFSKPENGGEGEQPFKRLQFGGSLGGPIKTDRAWFFGSMERVQQDFSLPRSARVIDEHRILLQALPGLDMRVTPSVPQPFRDLLFQVKGNVQLGQNHSAFVRYMGQNGYVDNPAIGTSRALLRENDFLHRNHQALWSAAAGWTWLLSPTAVNEFRAHYGYYLHDDISPACPDFHGCLLNKLTFPAVGTGVNNVWPHWYNYEEKLQVKDDFSKQVGSHAFKLGGDYTLFPVFTANNCGACPGSLSFFDDPSVIVGNLNGRYPLGFRTPGIVRQLVVTSDILAQGESKEAWSGAAYLQDDWRISRRVTLNLGLRYDIHEMMNNCCWADNRAGQVLRAIGHPYGQIPKTDRNNVAPRLGAAWDIGGDGKNVVRGSLGWFYGTGLITSGYAQNRLSGDVIFISQTLTNSAVGSGPLANFVLGVTPLPLSIVNSPTDLPRGQSSSGSWYRPDFKDAYSRNAHAGFSRMLAQNMVLSADYMHVDVRNGWWRHEINPLLDTDNNPATARIRPLSVDMGRVLGDPAILGSIVVLAPVSRGVYDGLDVHFERRLAQNSVSVNYTLSYARGTGGSTDFTTQGGQTTPETCGTLGCDYDIPSEWGPTQYDERHRITVAGVVPLPFGIDVAPSFTAASARPYTQYRAQNPNGSGSLYVLKADGTPAGPNNARGVPLVNLNARVTKNLSLSTNRTLAVFVEFYNILNRANFGNSFGGNAFAPATYNRPNGYLGGIASTTTIPISFQMQFGARYSF